MASQSFSNGFNNSFNPGLAMGMMAAANARWARESASFILNNAFALGEIPPHIKKQGLIYYELVNKFPMEFNAKIQDKDFSFIVDNIKPLGLDLENVPKGFKIIKKHRHSLLYGTDIKVGDVITKIGDIPLQKDTDIMKCISCNFKVGDKIPITVLRVRDDKQTSIKEKTINIVKRPLFKIK